MKEQLPLFEKSYVFRSSESIHKLITSMDKIIPIKTHEQISCVLRNLTTKIQFL